MLAINLLPINLLANVRVQTMKSVFKFPVQAIYDGYRKLVANPKYRWWIVAATLVYLVDPFDAMPDMLPLIGQIDDAALIAMVVAEIMQFMGDRAQAMKPSAPTETSSSTVIDVSPIES
jgi:uncharacterized membrane protein YkvA (DUF1232 family)